jgi:cyclopropane-fatty-acyl-phospholipid synthase
MWEFYLAGCEMVFRRQGHMNAQIQVAKSVDAVPLTRDYMVDWERRHAAAPPAEAKGHLKSVG